VINFRKPAYGALLGFVVVASAACGGSSATPAPASGAAPAANNGDASSLLTQALSSSSSIKSFHIKLTVGGTIKGAALASADSSGMLGTGDLKLDGTSVEGDVDLAKSAAHITFGLPALSQLGGMAITGDLIMADQTLYVKSALLGGAKYMKLPLSGLSSLTSSLPLPSDLPVAVPSTGTSGLSGMTSQLGDLQKQIADAGGKAEVVGTDSIGGADATHVKVTVPVAWIDQQLAAAEAAATPAADATPDPLAGAKLDSAGVDFWVYKDNNQLAQMHITGASSMIGNLDVMLTLTNYDKAVSISAPAASDVTDSSALFPANP